MTAEILQNLVALWVLSTNFKTTVSLAIDTNLQHQPVGDSRDNGTISYLFYKLDNSKCFNDLTLSPCTQQISSNTFISFVIEQIEGNALFW